MCSGRWKDRPASWNGTKLTASAISRLRWRTSIVRPIRNTQQQIREYGRGRAGQEQPLPTADVRNPWPTDCLGTKYRVGIVTARQEGQYETHGRAETKQSTQPQSLEKRGDWGGHLPHGGSRRSLRAWLPQGAEEPQGLRCFCFFFPLFCRVMLRCLGSAVTG